MLTASRAGTKRFQKLLNLPRRHRFTSTLVDSQQKYSAEGLVEYKRNVSINNYKYHFRRCSFQPLVKVEAKDASQPLHFKNGIKPSFAFNDIFMKAVGKRLRPKRFLFLFEHTSHQIDDENIVWTATFTSPITGELFKAGKLRYVNDDSIFSIDGEIFYKEKGHAESAAVGRAVDCFLYRGGFLSEVNEASRITFPTDAYSHFPAYCEEHPYDSPALCRERDLHCYRLNMFNQYESLAKNIPAVEYRRGGPRNTFWTASFRCSLSGEIFSSGTLRDRDEEVMMTHENCVYYGRKNAARIAAFGRAIDCLVSWGYVVGSHEKNTPTYCKEEPYDASSDSVLKADLIEEISPLSKAKGGVFDDKERGEHDKKEITVFPSDFPIKKIITSKYSDFLGGAIDDGLFSTTYIEVAAENENDRSYSYWTTSFACPLTGYTFTSGVVKDKRFIKNNMPSWRIQRNGVVYYLDKEMAELAAVGKACDYLNAADFGHVGEDSNGSMSLFCEEDPRSSMLFNEEEAEGEFIIQNVPNAYRANSDSVSPVDLLFEAWAESSRSNVNTFVSDKNTMSSKMYTINGRTNQTMRANSLFNDDETSPIDDIVNLSLNWYRRMVNKKVNDGTDMSMFNQTSISLASCNSILKALANSRRMSSPIYSKRNSSSNVEALAKQIIGCMYERSQDNLPGSSSLCPDVESLNSFIQCMERASLSSTARDAESLLNDMLHGRTFLGYKLPYPNIETFNAVIYHWSLVSDLECQTKINDIFERISKIESIHPNRVTFLSALSSSAFHFPSGTLFDTSNVNKWFEKIRNHNNQDDKDLIKLDTELFNAPLPWSGIDEKAGTKNIYGKEQLDASEIEKWVTEMERTGILPDIETYESVINGWSRCISQDGLERGDYWARRALDEAPSDPNRRLSLKTFRPLLEGWAATGSRLGVKRVKHWIRELDQISSNTLPDLKPDCRTRAMIILAWRNHQQSEKLRVLKKAKICSKILSELCNDVLENQISMQDDQLLMEPSIFNTTIDAWKEVPFEGSKDTIIEETLCIVENFNQIVDHISLSLFDNEESQVNVLSQYQKHHLRTFIEEGASVYKNAISVITQLEESRGQAKTVHHIESMLRRSEEYLLCMKSHRCRDIEKDIDVQLDLYKEVLRYCHIYRDQTQIVDILRIYSLIFDRLKKIGKDKNDMHLTDLFLQMIKTISFIHYNVSGLRSQIMSTILKNIDELESYVDKSSLLQATDKEGPRWVLRMMSQHFDIKR